MPEADSVMSRLRVRCILSLYANRNGEWTNARLPYADNERKVRFSIRIQPIFYIQPLSAVLLRI